jgi:general nucleoside transport system permease protein
MTTVESAQQQVRLPAEVRRQRFLGVVYLVLALIVTWFFALGSEGDATFRLGEAGQDIDLTFSAPAMGWFTAAVFAFLAGVHLTRDLGKWTNVVLAFALGLLALAFLAWAAQGGGSFSMLGMLRTTVAAATPIAFGGLSGVMCERVAVINIGIEGMLLTGAFMGAFVGTLVNPSSASSPPRCRGAFSAWLWPCSPSGTKSTRSSPVWSSPFCPWPDLVPERSADGGESRSFQQARGVAGDPDPLPGRHPLSRAHPLQSEHLRLQPVDPHRRHDIRPVPDQVGPAFPGRGRASQGGRHAGHQRLPDALPQRASSEASSPVSAAPTSPWDPSGSFNEGMTAGRGYIGLAAMIFGRWHPVGALGAALVFGFADSLQVRLSILDVGIPSDFLLMAPYIVTIIVVAGVVGRARPPAADGQPYIKQ